MRFLTRDEAQAWCRVGIVEMDGDGLPKRPSNETNSVRSGIPRDFTQLTWFCRYLEQALQPRDTCILWVTDWGIWTENLHLYYQLRRSYGDVRWLHEAPAALFHDFERAELVSFLQVGILCGWDMHLIPTSGYARLFTSHDEYVEYAANEANPDLAQAFLAGLDVATEPNST
jgi:hypothetical protein